MIKDLNLNMNSKFQNFFPRFVNFSQYFFNKGRRYCQIRLVEPAFKSLNNSDCFILVNNLQRNVFLYIGENSNIIEKSKANEIYEWIRNRKDLGIHKSQTEFQIIQNNILINENDNCTVSSQEFLSYLSQDGDSNSLLLFHEEDEKYEALINETNLVYKVIQNNKSNEILMDYEEENGSDFVNNENELDDRQLLSLFSLEQVTNSHLLSYNMLKENEVFLFDFGTEFYVWNGRNSSNNAKKAGLLLAKNIYENGYDHSEFRASPFGSKKTASNRPEWTLFGRQTQNLETVLFREKFFDWPAQKNSPTMKKNAYNPVPPPLSISQSASNSASTTPRSLSVTSPRNLFEYEPIGEQVLCKLLDENIQNEENPVNLVLENTNLGRGDHWFDAIERRSFDIVTEQVQMFKLVDNQLLEIDRKSFGILNSKFTYVIKWQYKVNAVGFRTLKGDLSQHHLITGRDRYCLFFWHGELTSSNEKGTSALLSLENLAASIGSNLASDLSSSTNASDKRLLIPHLQVFQFKEMAAFCRLFNSKMIILNENNKKQEKEQPWRMFELRGEVDREIHLIEIRKVSPESLRTKTCFLFLNNSENTCVVWHGYHSDDHQRKAIISCAQNVIIRYENYYLMRIKSGLFYLNKILSGLR
jgi:supervillin